MTEHQNSSAESAGLDIPPERHRTDEQRKDIHRAWDIVGMVTDGHLLNSTEGHLAVLRGIQMGRRLSGNDAQPTRSDLSSDQIMEILRRTVQGELLGLLTIGRRRNDGSDARIPSMSAEVLAREFRAASQPSPAATVETRLTCANCKSSLDAQDAPLVCSTCREMGAAPSLIQRTTELLGEADQLIKREGASNDARAVANVLANGIEDLLKAMRGKCYAMPVPHNGSSAGSDGAEEAIRDWWYSDRRQPMTSKEAAKSLIWYLAKCGLKIVREPPPPADSINQDGSGEWINEPLRNWTALSSAAAEGISWRRVNGEPFEYAIQQGPHGDKFVKLRNGTCLRRPLTATEPQSVGTQLALAEMFSHAAVDEAMQDAWNDICSDTGCHPLDIEHGKGKHLTFRPNHWANQVAKRLFVRAVKVQLKADASQPRAATVETVAPSRVLCPHCGLQGGHSRMCQDGQ